MTMDAVNHALWGALAVSCWIAGLFFLKFWRVSKDRFFLFFLLAFWVLSLNWIVLIVEQPILESRQDAYVIRLLAFVLIIVGVVDKNRRASNG
jgi:hypothetical protein